MNLLFLRDRVRTSWKVYMGVGILSALAGYVFSAFPVLILPVLCAGLAVWLIDSGLQEQSDQAHVPIPMRLVRRFLAPVNVAAEPRRQCRELEVH